MSLSNPEVLNHVQQSDIYLKSISKPVRLLAYILQFSAIELVQIIMKDALDRNVANLWLSRLFAPVLQRDLYLS